MKIEEDIILIAGPTASGKTSAGIKLAQENDAVILNADSMQVYEDLRIVSARPSDEEIAQAPHHLFGHRSGAEAYSVAHWLEDVRALFQKFSIQSRKMIFVGGTGQYFNALLEGISPMPDIKPEIRNKIRSMVDVPSQELHTMLDEKAARELRPSDRQRITRALEVYQSSGKSIIDWQAEKGEAMIPDNMSVKKFLVMPPRADIHKRINMRFDKMVEEGALDEIEALMKKNLESSLPVMKAIGVPQLAAHLAGELSIEEAIEKAKAATRQYAKRQSTWFNNSFDEAWECLVGVR
jgi:tRNA dimethylallyltransferase